MSLGSFAAAQLFDIHHWPHLLQQPHHSWQQLSNLYCPENSFSVSLFSHHSQPYLHNQTRLSNSQQSQCSFTWIPSHSQASQSIPSPYNLQFHHQSQLHGKPRLVFNYCSCSNHRSSCRRQLLWTPKAHHLQPSLFLSLRTPSKSPHIFERSASIVKLITELRWFRWLDLPRSSKQTQNQSHQNKKLDLPTQSLLFKFLHSYGALISYT